MAQHGFQVYKTASMVPSLARRLLLLRCCRTAPAGRWLSSAAAAPSTVWIQSARWVRRLGGLHGCFVPAVLRIPHHVLPDACALPNATVGVCMHRLKRMKCDACRACPHSNSFFDACRLKRFWSVCARCPTSWWIPRWARSTMPSLQYHFLHCRCAWFLNTWRI